MELQTIISLVMVNSVSGVGLWAIWKSTLYKSGKHLRNGLIVALYLLVWLSLNLWLLGKVSETFIDGLISALVTFLITRLFQQL